MKTAIMYIAQSKWHCWFECAAKKQASALL